MQAKKDSGDTAGLGHIETELKQYSVVYVKRCAPAETHDETISALDVRDAHQKASRLFADSVILRIRKVPAPGQLTEYPGARFIHGRFQPAVP